MTKQNIPQSKICFFVSDLHGHTSRYEKLMNMIIADRPDAVFIGGDILPGLSMQQALNSVYQNFIQGYVVPKLAEMKAILGDDYPHIFIILGNDDGRYIEPSVQKAAAAGYWEYVHNSKIRYDAFTIYGYACVPPTPFRLKDWERYDVSRYVDPGCMSPEEGSHSVPTAESKIRYTTIKKDLEKLTGEDDLSKSIFLFHAPPYKTKLDRADLDDRTVDHVPLDVHIGSIAIKRFIKNRQPLVTLHGHVHESSRLTGLWKDRIGRTWMFNAAHDGPELSLIRFDLHNPGDATRDLL